MAKKPPPRTKKNDNGRRTKKKVSVLTTEKIEYIDYKDVNLLKRFISDRSKVKARRVTGNDTQQQAELARAIKNAREMALIPYVSRVTTQRNNRDRGRDRGPRDGAPREDAEKTEAVETVEAVDGDNGEATAEEIAAVVETTEASS
ncbi:MAG: small subunit ribosomal protein S18 [Verrucomicrobiales bacterium]|jgi:small subunit ribosomal protein S18